MKKVRTSAEKAEIIVKNLIGLVAAVVALTAIWLVESYNLPAGHWFAKLIVTATCFISWRWLALWGIIKFIDSAHGAWLDSLISDLEDFITYRLEMRKYRRRIDA